MKLIWPWFSLLISVPAFAQLAEESIPATKASREMLLPDIPVEQEVLQNTELLLTDSQSDVMAANPEHITLKVAVVVDNQMPALTDANVAAIIKEAKTTLADKLAFTDLNFEIADRLSVEEFIDQSLKNVPDCLASINNDRYNLGKEPDWATLKPKMVTFLKRWPLKELQNFFPKEEQHLYQDYDLIVEQLIATYKQKISTISKIKLANGQKLLAPNKIKYRSYTSWICAMRGQEKYDIILTNEFVLYDLISEPFPHTIFQKCKVGGASLHSPSRQIMPQRALFASTFGIENKLPFFDEDPKGLLSTTEKQQLTGMFILAHELGHAIFKLPDFYDHPEQCLMTTKAETDYVAGFNLLRHHPGSCSLCQPWVKARRQYFRAKWLREQGQFLAAADLFKDVLRNTPKNIDGSYRTFVADIGLNIAECYWLLGNKTEAKRWLQGAINIDPYNNGPAKQFEIWFGPTSSSSH